MRAWITAVLCAAALAVALAGVVIAQDQQGPAQQLRRHRRQEETRRRFAPPPADGDLPKIPSEYTKKDKLDLGNLQTFKTDVDQVTVDVAVLDNKGHFIPGIPKVFVPRAGRQRAAADHRVQHRRSAHDGRHGDRVQQQVPAVCTAHTWFQTLQLAWGFASTLKPEDYVAVIAYDIKPEILSDFTTNRMQTQEALQRLTIPAWSEANLFDAVTDTADRMSGIEGRKAILLISSGVDTFSKLTFDKTRKILQEAGVPIYAIGLMQTLRIMMEAGHAARCRISEFLQADNQMRTFATETGGQAFFPRF